MTLVQDFVDARARFLAARQAVVVSKYRVVCELGLEPPDGASRETWGMFARMRSHLERRWQVDVWTAACNTARQAMISSYRKLMEAVDPEMVGRKRVKRVDIHDLRGMMRPATGKAMSTHFHDRHLVITACLALEVKAPETT